MQKKKKTIIIATGGTGGHVFPAQALIEKLSLRHNIILVIDQRGKKYLYDNNDNDNDNDTANTVYMKKTEEALNKLNLNVQRIITLPTANLVGSFNKKILDSIYIILSILRLSLLFIITKPTLILGFGSYATVSSLIAGMITRTPILLHEQNAVIGKVNRIFLKFSSAIYTSFKMTLYKNGQTIPRYLEKKIIYTGNPIRSKFYLPIRCHNNSMMSEMSNEINKASSNETNKENGQNIAKEVIKKKIKILIICGSQGSHIFDMVIPDAILKLPDIICKQIILNQQITKKEAKNIIATKYIKSSLNDNAFTLYTFTNDIANLMHDADLIIARAGASTIAEIKFCRKPSILIPLKHATDNHQYYNAKDLENSGCAILVQEANFDAENISNILTNLIVTTAFPNIVVDTVDISNTSSKVNVDKEVKTNININEDINEDINMKNTYTSIVEDIHVNSDISIPKLNILKKKAQKLEHSDNCGMLAIQINKFLI